MITTAFANGAVELSKLDLGQIKALKDDDGLLKDTVHTLTMDYAKQVQELNTDEPEQTERYNPGKSLWQF